MEPENAHLEKEKTSTNMLVFRGGTCTPMDHSCFISRPTSQPHGEQKHIFLGEIL